MKEDRYACIRLENQLEELGLTYTQYIVMMAFWEYSGMTEKELGSIVRLDSGTLTPLLKRLEKLGLVTRSRQEQDERNLFVSLTEAGEALKEEAVKVPGKMAGCVNLSADELIQLKQLLDKALNRMEEEK